MRIYLVGAGVIARHHAAAARRLPAGLLSEIVVADPNPVAVAAFLVEHADARSYDDAATMLAEPAQDDDVVVVATPPFTHARLTIDALISGRHVLCEKPLATTTAEAEAMLTTAGTTGKLLGCCSGRFLGYAPTEEARRVVALGRLGQVYAATWVHRRQRRRTGIEYQPETPWFVDRSRSGGGVLMDWSPYDVTTLNHVLSPVRVDVLAAWTANPETRLDLPPGVVADVEQHVAATLRYTLPGGATPTVTFERAACTHGAERSTVEVEGTRGAVTWDWLDWVGTGSISISRDVAGRVETETTTPEPLSDLFVHHRPLVDFVRAVQGQSSRAVLNERAVFNFATLQAIYAAAETGRVQTVELRGSPVAA